MSLFFIELTQVILPDTNIAYFRVIPFWNSFFETKKWMALE
ncbi:MAG TPA: hypothetical protein VLL47_08915 [Robiginitalea sp.]|nr:hypothetical protein [Robiginitalea sp.]